MAEEVLRKQKNRTQAIIGDFGFRGIWSFWKAVTRFPVISKWPGEHREDLKGLRVKRDSNQREKGKQMLKKGSHKFKMHYRKQHMTKV